RLRVGDPGEGVLLGRTNERVAQPLEIIAATAEHDHRFGLVRRAGDRMIGAEVERHAGGLIDERHRLSGLELKLAGEVHVSLTAGYPRSDASRRAYPARTAGARVSHREALDHPGPVPAVAQRLAVGL